MVALDIVKARLGIRVDTLDTYLEQLLKAAKDKIEKQMGVEIDEDRGDHVAVWVDLAVWYYQNRDGTAHQTQTGRDIGAMPEWLRLELRALYLDHHLKKGGGD